MGEAFLVLVSTFFAVFFLGLQSLNVNQRQYVSAGVTSIFISSSHIALYKLVPDAGLLPILGYYLGGVTGITASIWSHPRIRARLEDWQTRHRLRKIIKKKLAQAARHP